MITPFCPATESMTVVPEPSLNDLRFFNVPALVNVTVTVAVVPLVVSVRVSVVVAVGMTVTDPEGEASDPTPGAMFATSPAEMLHVSRIS